MECLEGGERKIGEEFVIKRFNCSKGKVKISPKEEQSYIEGVVVNRGTSSPYPLEGEIFPGRFGSLSQRLALMSKFLFSP